MKILEGGRRNIVILGAGFGGITALLTLYRRLRRQRLLGRYRLILVNKSAQHLYTPALYEIASIPRGEASAICLKSAICIHIEDIISRYPGIRFLGEEVAALNPQARAITFRSGEGISFDYALVALGSETNFFNIPGLKEQAYPIKTFEDAVRLRNRAQELLTPSTRTLRVLIGGAGATGVELSAEFVNFLRQEQARLGARACREEILLLEASPEILPGFGTDIVRTARARLRKLGIKVKTGAAVTEVTPAKVLLRDGASLDYDLLVWAGGVKPVEVVKSFGLALDARGGVITNAFLEAAPGIYAIGDCASFGDPNTGTPLPRNVPVAEAEARVAAKNILAAITGGRKQPFRPLRSYPFILAVGGKYALTDLVILKLFGFLGWMAKQLVELRYLLFILPPVKAIRMWLRGMYYSTRND